MERGGGDGSEGRAPRRRTQEAEDGKKRGGAAVGEATLIVNIGDMGSAITGYQSTKHRVVNAEGRPRFSMPAFVDPNFDAEIPVAEIPVAGGQDRDRGRDQLPIVSGMYLLDKYKQTHT